MRRRPLRRLIRQYAVNPPRRIASEMLDRAAVCWRVVTRSNPLPPQPPIPPPGTWVLEVAVGGVFHVRIPDGIEEGDDRWDDWIDSALLAASLDGRWSDCTEIEDMQMGVLGERGSVLSPSETPGCLDEPRADDADGTVHP